MKWKSVVFAVAIALLFIPMVFLGVNTFFPEADYSDCDSIPICGPDAADDCLEGRELTAQAKECYEEQDKIREKYDGSKYITIIVICLIASMIMLVKLDKSIVFGLFTGIVITAFVGTIRYISSKSYIGFALLVVLFFVIIFFIQKEKD